MLEKERTDENYQTFQKKSYLLKEKKKVLVHSFKENWQQPYTGETEHTCGAEEDAGTWAGLLALLGEPGFYTTLLRTSCAGGQKVVVIPFGTA